MQEIDIEEILRCSIDMLCDDEESMLLPLTNSDGVTLTANDVIVLPSFLLILQ